VARSSWWPLNTGTCWWCVALGAGFAYLGFRIVLG
jgi:hypothetical protein